MKRYIATAFAASALLAAPAWAQDMPAEEPEAPAEEAEAPAEEAADRQALEGYARALAEALFRAVVRSHEEEAKPRMPAPELFSHGECRKDVAARAAGRQEDSLHGCAVLEKLRMRPTQSMVATRLEPP